MIQDILISVVRFLYPDLCGGCGERLLNNERHLCLSCMEGLPITYFWDYEQNPVERLFWGRIPVDGACSFFHFVKDSPAQRLMHSLKYQNRPHVGEALGKRYGQLLTRKEWFRDTDLIVPVPLHPSKEERRGYNQSMYIARGLADAMGPKVNGDALIRVKATTSQTRKARFDRAQNVEQVFRVVKPELFAGRRVMLVDDVVTTGATLEAAGTLIQEAGAEKLYVVTLAVA